MSLIWLMGPVAGTFVQPLMGLWSDSVTCRWGRRRPFVAGGTAGVLAGLLVVACAEDLARLTGASSRGLATVGVGTILLFIQPLQMGARAAIAECAPPHLVSQTNAWASRWTGLGAVAGYLLGALSPEDSIKALGAAAASLLVLSASTTCWMVREVSPLPGLRPAVVAARSISPAMQQLFKVQSCAWAAWFPFLYYGSTYIAESGRPILERAASPSRGNIGMFLFAIVALGFNLTLPELLSLCEITHGARKTIRGRAPLAILWMSGHLAHATIMFGASFLEGDGRIALVALAGFNWSLTQWVPFTLINDRLAEEELDAGLVMSLHNVAISLPQILSALLTGCILWVLRSWGVGDEVGILLSLTALPSLLAAYHAGRIKHGV